MAKLQVATQTVLDRFLTGCKTLFASQAEVTQNGEDINDYVLEITDEWYADNIAFDTSEIV